MNNNYNNGYSNDFSINNNKPNKQNNLNKKIYWIGNAVIAAIYIGCCVINYKHNSTVNIALYFGSALTMVFTYVGWWAFIMYPEKLKRKKEKCTRTVLALLCDYKVVEHRDDDGTTYSYYAIYQYEFNNIGRRVTSQEQYIGKREKMIQCKILINPDNPSEIYEIENERARIRNNRIGGLISMIAGLGFFFVIFIETMN